MALDGLRLILYCRNIDLRAHFEVAPHIYPICVRPHVFHNLNVIEVDRILLKAMPSFGIVNS